MKRTLSAVLAASMAIGLTACGSASSAPAASTTAAAADTVAAVAEATEAAKAASSDEKPITIAFFMFENSNTFTTYIRKALESYGAEHNVTVESFDGKSDQSAQTDAITTALAKGKYDVIVVNPVDSGAGSTINQKCQEAGVPVIYCDRAPDLAGGILDTYDKSYYVGLDWSDPGRVQAEMVYEDWKTDASKLDKNGDGVLQYVILQGNVAQQNAIYRTQAIHDLMDQWNSDGTMKNEQLDIQDGNWDTAKGKDVMDTWNVKYGDKIEAVLSNNDTMAMGAIESLKTNGNFDKETPTVVYGINGIPDVWTMLEDGTMAGTVLTSPYQEAVAVIDMCRNLVDGKEPLDGTDFEFGEFKKDVRVPNSPIRVENIDEAKHDYIQ